MMHSKPRQQSRKRRTLFLGAALLFVLFLAVGTWNALRPLPPVSATSIALSTAVPAVTAFSWPAEGEAAVEAQGLTNIFTHGDSKALPTASIAKVITCLTVFQAKPFNTGQQGQTITLSQADVDIYNKYVAEDGSVVHVASGEQLTQYQATQAMLLPSANNIADSYAIWAFGSLDAYRTAATAYVKGLGLSDTTIGSDASGLSPDTTSTPADLVHIGEQALANSTIAEIVAQKSATLPVEGRVQNVDSLIGTNGIIGIKTGNIDEVGGNFLFAGTTDVAPGKTVTIVGAVMGQANLGAALRASVPLLDSAKANLYVATPVQADESVGTYRAAWGAQATAVAQQNISFVAWKGNPIKPKIALRSNVSYAGGSTVGVVSVVSDTANGTSSVVLKTAIAKPSFWWRLFRH